MLIPLQIDKLDSMCWQGGLPSRTTTGMLKWEMTSPVLLPYTTIGINLHPCEVPLPLFIPVTTRVGLILLREQ